VLPFLVLAVLAGEGFELAGKDFAADTAVEEDGVVVVLELGTWDVGFEVGSVFEDDTVEGLVGDMAGFALGETVVEDNEDVGSSLAGCSNLVICDVAVPFRSLSS
jgi:hypothetical protein